MSIERIKEINRQHRIAVAEHDVKTQLRNKMNNKINHARSLTTSDELLIHRFFNHGGKCSHTFEMECDSWMSYTPVSCIGRG